MNTLLGSTGETAMLQLNYMYNLVCLLCFLLSLFITHALSLTSMDHSVLYCCDDSLIQLTEISSVKCSNHQLSVKKLEITSFKPNDPN